MQPLTGTRAGDLDLDVVVGTQPGEADHLAREVDDRYRLAHVEQEDLASVGHRAGLEHEAHGFRDGHEVAGHVAGSVTVTGPPSRIWRRNVGTTLPRLPSTLPKRTADERAGRTAGRPRTRSARPPLRRAHHRARVRGLVGGDVHEAGRNRTPPRSRASHQVPSTFVRDRLDRVALEHRHVLVGGGVEHDLGPVALEDRAEPGRRRGCRRAPAPRRRSRRATVSCSRLSSRSRRSRRPGL